MKRDLEMPMSMALSQSVDWKSLYDQLLPRVYHFFCYQTGDPALAEELTAATFEKAWASRRHYDHKLGKLPAWILGIARKVSADYFRRRKVETPLDSTTIVSKQNVEEDVEKRLDFERLSGLLADLPERERYLIALKYGGELNNREIARLTRLSETNVSTILFRAVSKLREEWSQKA